MRKWKVSPESVRGWDATKHIEMYAKLKWGQLNTLVGLVVLLNSAVISRVLLIDGEIAGWLILSLLAATASILLAVIVMAIKFWEFHDSFRNSVQIRKIDWIKDPEKKDWDSDPDPLRKEVASRRTRANIRGDALIVTYFLMLGCLFLGIVFQLIAIL